MLNITVLALGLAFVNHYLQDILWLINLQLWLTQKSLNQYVLWKIMITTKPLASELLSDKILILS